MLFLGIGKYSVYQLNSLIVTISRTSEIIGLIINFIVGAVIAAMTYLSLKKRGHRYSIVICIMIGFITWLLWEFIFTLAVEGKTIEVRPIADYYNHLAGTFAFGFSMGFLIKWKLFESH